MRQREKLHLLYTVYIDSVEYSFWSQQGWGIKGRVRLMVQSGMGYKGKSTVSGPNRDGVLREEYGFWSQQGWGIKGRVQLLVPTGMGYKGKSTATGINRDVE